MLLEMKVDASRRHHPRAGRGRIERQGQSRHRYRVWIVHMNDLRLRIADDARQLPCRRQIDFASRCKGNEIRTFGGASIELALAVRHEQRAMTLGPQAEDRQEDLVLSAAPGAGGVDVEREHSSQSFANLSPT